MDSGLAPRTPGERNVSMRNLDLPAWSRYLDSSLSSYRGPWGSTDLPGSLVSMSDGVVSRLHVEADLLALVLAGQGGDLGGVQRGDLAGDGQGLLQVEVDVVDAELFVEELDLVVHLGLRDDTRLEEEPLDCGRGQFLGSSGSAFGGYPYLPGSGMGFSRKVGAT